MHSFLPEKNYRDFIQKVYFFLFIIITSIFVFLHLNRIFYGVDFEDEAYYSAITYRFVLGDIPFIDDISMHQTASLLTIPLVKMLHIISGSMDGIILSMRFFYLIAAAGVSFLIYYSIRALTSLSFYIVTFISLLCMLYIPFGVYTMSYNNIATITLTATMFLIFLKENSKENFTKTYIVAGISTSIGVIAYPPLSIFPVFYIIILLLKTKVSNKKIKIYIAGLIVPLLVFMLYLLSLGIPEILYNMSFVESASQGGGAIKFLKIFKGFIRNFPFIYFSFPYLIISAIIYKILKKQILVLLIIPVLILPFWSGSKTVQSTVILFEIFYGMLLPYLMLFTEKSDPFPKKILWFIWIPSFFAGFITAWSSANGFVNFSVGFFPATIATTLLAIHILNSIKISNQIIINSAIYFCTLLPVLIFSIYNYGFIYGEGTYSNKLNSRIESGPYFGLITTPEKKLFLNNFEEMIQRYKYKDYRRILFYDLFPAGYLFSSSRPASNVVWQLPVGWYGVSRTPILKYLENPDHQPSLVIRTKKVYWLVGDIMKVPSINDRLDSYINSHYIPLEDNEWFTVLTRRSDI